MTIRSLPGTPSWLGATNDRTALALFLQHGALTRNQLGELSGLSKPTASQMIARLESAALIEAVGELSGGRGPNAVSYGVRRGHTWGVAIDVQPEVIRSCVVDAVGGVGPVVEYRPQPGASAPGAAAELRDAIARACEAAGANHTAVAVAAVGLQGAVNPQTDELNFTDELPGWPRHEVRATLERELGLDLLLSNDVNLAAVAERTDASGAGAEAGGFALFWVGNGLGLAVDIGGVLHAGASGGAGEMGYLAVPRAATEIDPEARDLQDLISGDALIGIARAHGLTATGFESMLAEIQAHPARSAILSEFAPRIALGIAPVLAVLDPELLLLGGPTGALGGEELATLVSEHIRAHTRWSPRISPAGVVTHPVLSGARWVLINELRERLFLAVTPG
ncbi:ROK family transcriptional regulator [Mycetocola spongiae]|uniref:ROK family transcriptional regulator n=1 Tax=Mycetocola spongiae TaxID=2859226 RepID=UPI001CF1957F|nr:ROK family transcriptional regulator [Mycetocola spongiae]